MKYIILNIFYLLILSSTLISSGLGEPETCSISRPKKPDKCHQPKKEGECTDNIPSYFYNSKTGKCERFTYRGCEGNENRFATYQLCASACYTWDEDLIVDQCQQPKLTGSCEKFSKRYYYNAERGDCEEFIYSECEGNDNRFDTYELCEYACKHSATKKNKYSVCMCYEPPDMGPGTDYVKRYYYNPKSSKCESFIYGGSKGNDNRFESNELCEYVCNQKKADDADQDEGRCKLPKETGKCSSSFLSYFYNSETGKCEQFTYSGCDGNDNRFETHELCEKACTYKSSKKNELSTCKCYLPAERGNGTDYVKRYFYNPKLSKCEEFIYGSTGGNENRFETFELCESTCNNQNFTISSEKDEKVDRCHQPKMPGPCLAAYKNYFYNAAKNKCEEFIYGGCGGNENKFETYELCENACKVETSQPMESGPCECYPSPDQGLGNDNLKRWYYMPIMNTCREFVFGGTGGNKNRFDTLESCHNFCYDSRRPVLNNELESENSKSEAPEFKDSDSKLELNQLAASDLCQQPLEVGDCRASIPKYFYNAEKRKCEEFMYGGCGGNENKFETLQSCENACKVETSQPMKFFSCEYYSPPDKGPGSDYLIRYYYDPMTNACHQFIYGGIAGNENRFDTHESCHDFCYDPRKPILNFESESDDSYFKPESNELEALDSCQQPPEAGPCRASFRKYFYNAEKNKCEKFTWGGCGGNQNRFDSLILCKNACIRV